jgi:hypothetical protein
LSQERIPGVDYPDVTMPEGMTTFCVGDRVIVTNSVEVDPKPNGYFGHVEHIRPTAIYTPTVTVRVCGRVGRGVDASLVGGSRVFYPFELSHPD